MSDVQAKADAFDALEHMLHRPGSRYVRLDSFICDPGCEPSVFAVTVRDNHTTEVIRAGQTLVEAVREAEAAMKGR